MNLLCQALKKTGPCLSSELAEALVEQHGLSPEAARQRVSRGAPGVNKLKSLKFPNRSVFVYFQEDYRNHEFNIKLTSSILKSKSSYSYALMSILARGGIVRKDVFYISCGSPIQQKKKMPSSSVAKRFLDSGVVEEVNIPGVGPCFATPEKYKEIINGGRISVNKARSRILVEEIVLDAVKSWSKNLGIVSYNRVGTRTSTNTPKFGTFNWDLVAPSYLPHLSRKDSEGNLLPGFFVCDILLGIKVGEKAALPFIKKFDDTESIKSIPPCIYMHMADGYTKESFNMLKSKGIIPATPASLFGNDVAEGLSELMKALSYAGTDGVSEEQYDEIFRKLSFIEGVAGNLRGALFEFIAAEIIKSMESFNEIEMNKILVENRKTVAECDVIAFKRNFKVCFIECKGHALDGFADNREIKKWLTQRIPNIRQFALSHPDWKDLDLEFNFWTTGKINDEGIEMISKIKNSVKKYSVDYLDGDGVLKEARRQKKNGLADTLENHFVSMH